MFEYQFMQQAFVASTLIAITCGTIGVFVVARHMSFMSHTLSEIGFAGAAFGVLVGISPLTGMLIFTLAGSISVGFLSSKVDQNESTISAISSLFIGFGVLFLALSSKSSSYATNILFGSIVGISANDVLEIIVLSIVILLILLSCFNQLVFNSFDPIGSQAAGINGTKISVIFLIMMALSVSVGAQIVGSLLVFVLLTLPGATAHFFGHSVKSLIAISVSLAVAGVWFGLIMGYYTDLPITFFISTFEVVAYFIGLFKEKKTVG